MNGGFSPYEFRWSNPSNPWFSSTNQNLYNISAGTYCVEVTDALCGTLDLCIDVIPCNILLSGDVVQPISGQSDGKINLQISDPYPPFNITWSNGATNTTSLSGLSPGVYIVNVENANGCVVTKMFTLLNCPTITVSTSISSLQNPTTCGTNDGSFKLNSNSATGGVPPYTYTWEDGDGNQLNLGSGPVYYNLASGTYCRVATDANGCRGKRCITLLAPGEPQFTVLEENFAACEGQSNGAISVGMYSIGTKF